jgi:TonB family protein
MKRSILLALLSTGALSGMFYANVEIAFAQAAVTEETPHTGAVLTKLSPPVYPPLARQANILGEVKVNVAIRRDGSVASAELFSGHPMLAPAALESARQSQFECRGCRDAVTTLALTYAFEMKDDGDCCSAMSHTPEVTQSLNRIVVFAAHLCLCDPGPTLGQRVRAAKCLYLWKCGLSEH